jgi:hypothetical protein
MRALVGQDRGWEQFHADEDEFPVLQAGPRRLWDEVEAACRWWRDAGSPRSGAWKVACGGGCCSAPVHGTLIQLLGMSASWCRCAEPLRVGSSATYLSSCKNELNSAGSLTAMAPLSTSRAFPGVMSDN